MPLELVADGIWTTARPQKFWGVECGTRMTIVRLDAAGAARPGLFVHCPVALDSATRAEIDALGDVRAIAASSLYHHLYVGDWMRAYPSAIVAGCPGLAEKRGDLAFTHRLGDEPHPAWERDLQQVFFSARFEKEVVFFHDKTGTLVTADALLNLSTHPSRRTRLVARFMGNSAPGKGWLEYFAVRDRVRARREVDRMLGWDIQRIVLAHGALVPAEGRRALEDAYAWL